MPLFEPPPPLVYNVFVVHFDEMLQNGRFYSELATAAGGADFGAQKTAGRPLAKSMDTIPETAFFLPTESPPYGRGKLVTSKENQESGFFAIFVTANSCPPDATNCPPIARDSTQSPRSTPSRKIEKSRFLSPRAGVLPMPQIARPSPEIPPNPRDRRPAPPIGAESPRSTPIICSVPGSCPAPAGYDPGTLQIIETVLPKTNFPNFQKKWMDGLAGRMCMP